MCQRVGHNVSLQSHHCFPNRSSQNGSYFRSFLRKTKNTMFIKAYTIALLDFMLWSRVFHKEGSRRPSLEAVTAIFRLSKRVFTWIRIKLQSGSNWFRLLRREKNKLYLLHESRLSFNSFRIEFIPFFILDRTLDPERNIELKSCKHGSRFHCGMKSTFIMAEIKVIYKMGSFIHIVKCVSAKIAKKIRCSVHESQTSLNPEWDFQSPRPADYPQLNLPCKHGLNFQ